MWKSACDVNMSQLVITFKGTTWHILTAAPAINESTYSGETCITDWWQAEEKENWLEVSHWYWWVLSWWDFIFDRTCIKFQSSQSWKNSSGNQVYPNIGQVRFDYIWVFIDWK